MRELEIYCEDVELQPEKLSDVRYFIVVDEIMSDTGTLLLESYGVGIRINGKEGGEAVIRHLTTSVRKIEGLILLLAENNVTPVCLRDIVDDWLLII